MKLTDLFRKKKPQPGAGQPADVPAGSAALPPGAILPQMPIQAGAQEQRISVEQLKATLQQQKDKVQELKTVISEYKESIEDVHDASEQLDEQEKALKQQVKEQTAFLSDSRVLPKSKQDIKQSLKPIRKWLFEIDEAQSVNRKSLKELTDAIRVNERAIKINGKAIRENERAIKLISESKEGQQFDIKAKGIEDLMKGMMPEGLPSEEQVEPATAPVQQIPPVKSEPQVIIPPIEASGFGKMKEDDYWKKGKIAG